MDDLYPDHAYSAVYMKKKLMEQFNDQIVITEINGIPNSVTLKKTVSTILNEFYKQDKDLDPSQKKMSIIQTAAKLIWSDIKDIRVSKAFYPPPQDISDLKKTLSTYQTLTKDISADPHTKEDKSRQGCFL
ncbi:hypothetical protein DPMN_033637 [Dreissena polymorpha]|uniref:Uncharacterized protein n=1 Tax=Dreissena polymorpha TaxID=45954 RepID=A0A9D4RJB4_DREPO|nr:hypothetical protein DPMN_033637 [Dreissena polymorpha]